MSERVKAGIYLPAVATFPKDLETRNRILDLARERGIDETGLMVVANHPENILIEENVRKQLDNLEPFVKLSENERPKVVVMHPWRPLTGTTVEPINLMTNSGWSKEYIEQGIDLAAKIPDEIAPKRGRVLTFHASAYIMPNQWFEDEDYWREHTQTMGKVVGVCFTPKTGQPAKIQKCRKKLSEESIQ
jgi:hypothetical protein